MFRIELHVRPLSQSLNQLLTQARTGSCPSSTRRRTTLQIAYLTPHYRPWHDHLPASGPLTSTLGRKSNTTSRFSRGYCLCPRRSPLLGLLTNPSVTELVLYSSGTRERLGTTSRKLRRHQSNSLLNQYPLYIPTHPPLPRGQTSPSLHSSLLQLATSLQKTTTSLCDSTFAHGNRHVRLCHGRHILQLDSECKATTNHPFHQGKESSLSRYHQQTRRNQTLTPWVRACRGQTSRLNLIHGL